MKPATRRRAAMVVLIMSLIGWPLSALTFARHEPQFILGLSWLAISLTCADIWATTDARKAIDD